MRELGNPKRRRSAHLAAFVFAVLCAGVGVAIYAVGPGVGSFQLSGILALPALIVCLVWLHRRLPMWLQWTLAVAIAPIGSLGYLVAGGAQWWAWGPLTAVPLVLLAMLPTFPKDPNDWESEPWYGGPTDGPWGPP